MKHLFVKHEQLRGVHDQLLLKHQQLNADHVKLQTDHEQLSLRNEQLDRDHNQLSSAHDQIKVAWRASWSLLHQLIAENSRLIAKSRRLLQRADRQHEERTSLKRDYISTKRAEVEHRKLWEGEQRKLSILLALAVDFQAELSTLRPLQFRTKGRVTAEFIQKLLELIGGWKPTS